MPLASGDRLGPYEISAPLGAGGMGEVYRARDTRLDRPVAIKVLPEHIARRDDVRQRFEREARAVASLNHPHICTLYDIGDGYMVMELIEGETLAARIAKGAIPVAQAIPLAIQIADALDRAHRAGVTHRDVKPQNIMLTRDGVKVLDFGLAKSIASKPGPAEETLSKVLTAEGSVLGTPQYMAPEQFEGREADTRSDVWAFGAVVYEMVSGEKAFRGDNYASLVTAIVSAEPAAALMPAWLDRVVKRCLRKDPEDRYQSMRDVVLELQSPAPDAQPVRANRWPWAVAAAFALAAAGLWLRTGPTGATAPPMKMALEVTAPDGVSLLASGGRGGSVISPDGRTLAFVAKSEKSEYLLYVRPLDSPAARALPGTEDAGRMFWSPDSKWLAFIAQDKLKRIDPNGGPPVTFHEAGSASGGGWNEQGVILLGSTGSAEGIQRISATSGGPATLVTRIPREGGERAHRFPRFLPGGRDFLYLVTYADRSASGIAFGSLDSKPAGGAPVSIVARTAYEAHYDPASGMLLYIQGEQRLVAQRLELNPPRLTGDPVTLAEGVRTNFGFADFSVSRNGTLFYGRGSSRSRTRKTRFAWRDRSGQLVKTIGETIDSSAHPFALSPDETRVAYSTGSEESLDQVWVMDLANGRRTRVTFDEGHGSIWSPDGRFVYYRQAGIFRKLADGSGEAERLSETPGPVTAVSPDGKTLLYDFGEDIWKLPTGNGSGGAAEDVLSFSGGWQWSAVSGDGA